MQSFLPILSAFALVSLSVPIISTDDFSVSGSKTQSIAVPADNHLTVRCYCPTHTVVEGKKPGVIELRFSATLKSVGYHGHQDTPVEIPPSLMLFSPAEGEAGAVFQSHEFTFIHHSFVISELEVSAPPSITVSFEEIPHRSLEGRQVQ